MANKYVKLRSKERKFSQQNKGLTREEAKSLAIEKQIAMREQSHATSKERIDAKKLARQKKAAAEAEAREARRLEMEEAKKLARQKAEEEKAAKRREREERHAQAQAKAAEETAAKKAAEEEAAKKAAEEEAAKKAAEEEAARKAAEEEAARKAAETEAQAQAAVEVYKRLRKLTKAEVIRQCKIAGKGADEAITTFKEMEKKIEDLNAEIKAAKTPKDADEAVRAEFNAKRAALRKEREKCERERVIASARALSLEKVGDEYTLVARYITGEEDLSFRKTERLQPVDPDLREKALPLFERL
ncbi:MAG: hypothetical protein J5785_04015 [Spirochaetales bacterium]|nr:hypothetical protein [Spirochaetales bacterium]